MKFYRICFNSVPNLTALFCAHCTTQAFAVLFYSAAEYTLLPVEQAST